MTLPEVILSSSLIAFLAGTGISLITSYVPGFAEWFAGKTETEKKLGMLIAMFLVTLVIGIVSWTGVWVIIPATKEGLLILGLNFFEALIANQSVFGVSPTTLRVERAKSEAEVSARFISEG